MCVDITRPCRHLSVEFYTGVFSYRNIMKAHKESHALSTALVRFEFRWSITFLSALWHRTQEEMSMSLVLCGILMPDFLRIVVCCMLHCLAGKDCSWDMWHFCNLSNVQECIYFLSLCFCLVSYNILDGYPASLGFPIMHRVHVICIHPCHNCHDIK